MDIALEGELRAAVALGSCATSSRDTVQWSRSNAHHLTYPLPAQSQARRLPPFTLSVSGSSLLGPIPEHRTLVVLNTGIYRGWWQEPFALVHNGFMLLYDDASSMFALVPFGSQHEAETTPGATLTQGGAPPPPYAAFNFYERDRDDGRNLWPKLGVDEKRAWLSLVCARPYLQRILLAGYVGRGSHLRDGLSVWDVA